MNKKPLSSYDLCLATAEEAEILNEKIDLFNSEQLSFHDKFEELRNYVIKGQGNIIAGIRVVLYLNECMFISVLFVEEQHRGKGLGTRLLKHAEEQAKSIGIRLVHLDSFDFQAKDFYLKQGYEIFGVLNDCPKGHKRYFLKKEIA